MFGGQEVKYVSTGVKILTRLKSTCLTRINAIKPGAEFFLNLAMFTSRTRLIRNNRDSLARLFVPVTLIRLFFKKWFTYFCDIYVFLLKFRIK